ncbi:MAG: L,D-transpeptidase family protein [Pseudomonadota bacterium]
MQLQRNLLAGLMVLALVSTPARAEPPSPLDDEGRSVVTSGRVTPTSTATTDTVEPEVAAAAEAAPEPNTSDAGSVDASGAEASDQAREDVASAANPGTAKPSKAKSGTPNPGPSNATTDAASPAVTGAVVPAATAPVAKPETREPEVAERETEKREAAQPEVAETAPVTDAFRALLVDLAKSTRAGRTPEAQADARATAAFYEMRDGRPLWVNGDGISESGKEALRVLETADEWGLDAVDYRINTDLLTNISSDDARAKAELAITHQVLRYAFHARGGRVDPSRLSYEIFVERPIKSPQHVLADLVIVEDMGKHLTGLHPRHHQFHLLREAYLKMRATGPSNTVALANPNLTRKQRRRLERRTRSSKRAHAKALERIRINLEFWRWLPEDLGATHVFANLPEFRVRVLHDGEYAFEERVIIGKTSTQTPLMSDEMNHLIFRPYWNLPNSIKVKKLLPGLLRGRNSVAANGLRIKRGSRELSPTRINWRRTDIRNFHVYQPPGPGNALGNVKFMFPNRHAIYMHDTPTKHLFRTRQRNHSAGCVRVRNPDEFARVLLEIANDWDRDETTARYRRGPENERIDFDRTLPVHLGYFTAWVNEETGEVEFFKDIYKHERHLKFALAGQYNRIVRVKRSVEADVQRIKSSVTTDRGNSGGGSWWGTSGFTGSGGSSQGSTPVGRSPNWMQNAFGSNG